ncbi:MAG: PAS domain S-box protein [Candidatus Rokubacteria bacterium]|nr:PAS domain S-box protein [Candidatus Rokubacteria bacterium]
MTGFIKPLRRWGLGQKLSATLCILVFGVALLISFFVMGHEERALDAELRHRGSNIVRTLARLSVEPVLQDDPWGLYKVARDIVRSENVMVYAMVLDPRGDVFSHSDPARFPIGEPLPTDPLTSAALTAEGLLIQVGRDPAGETVYHVTLPIVLDGQRLGVARIGVTRRYLEGSLTRLKRDVFVISALLAALGMALGLVISRRMTRSLERLSASVRALSQGRLDEWILVETKEKDEIGLLADSFNQMAESLRERIREIQATKRYLENLLENANDFIYTLALGGTFTYVNRKFLELGYAKGEFIGRPASAFLLASGDGRAEGNGREAFEARLQAKEGAERVVVVTTSPLRDNEGAVVGTLGLAKDITERKELEQRLLRSEKLATIGEMAGAMAHEIRNPLGSIYTAVNLLSVAPERPIREEQLVLLKTIRDETMRLNRILTDFLRFARPRSPLFRPHDVNGLVEEVLAALRHDEAARGNAVYKELDPRLGPIEVDADQVKQVLWNVVLNSLQAVGTDGNVVVATAREDGTAKIRVRDNGRGIPGEELSRIFEPFQTTKGGGMGLGLAIVQRIVEAHGGRITIASEEGKGTLVEIHLPIRRS